MLQFNGDSTWNPTRPELVEWRGIHHSVEQDEMASNRRQTKRSVLRLCRTPKLVELFVGLRRLDQHRLRNAFVQIGQVRDRVETVDGSAEVGNLLLHDRRNVPDVWFTIRDFCSDLLFETFFRFFIWNCPNGQNSNQWRKLEFNHCWVFFF